jgi:isopenicillin N synthase-like dioxygenase
MTAVEEFDHVPIIDIGSLVRGTEDRSVAADAIGRACRDCGFFYIVGHGVAPELCQRLEQLSREFFALPQPAKMRISMARGGRAWRGYFPVGNELTSGKPDLKEGIYFGAELSDDDERVKARLPLHGANLFPEIPGFRDTVLHYIEELTRIGHALMTGLALSLGLADDYFAQRYTGDPLVLFRIFNYPSSSRASTSNDVRWGVGEHTDYGLLTILLQDETGGLQVKSQARWIDAPPIAGSFICNIGDMLDRMTRGLYRSTPHRVLNIAQRDRLSFPFFFDPNFAAQVQPIDTDSTREFIDDRHERWDQASVHEFRGTYGEYLLNKVAKVFPQLRKGVL